MIQHSVPLTFLCLLVLLPQMLVAQDSPKPQEEMERLQRRLQILRAERAKHEQGIFFRASREEARQMEEDGLQTLHEFDPLATATGVAVASVKPIQDWLKRRYSKSFTEEDRHIWQHITKAPKVFVDTHKALEELRRLAESGHYAARDIDIAIKKFEALKNGLSPLGFDPAISDMSGLFFGTTLTLLNVARATKSPPHERKQYYTKAAKEWSGAAGAAVKLGKEASQVVPMARLAATTAEPWWRIGHWAAASLAARGLRSEADEIQSKTIAGLNYNILVTQYEMDQLARKSKMKPQKEPGGIKLNGQRADEWAVGLDIQSVRYDPIRGTLVLSGERSQHTVDMEIFSTVLRLALEHHEPFFSLTSTDHKDWDSVPTRAGDLLRRKYFTTQQGQQQVADRMRKLSPPLKFRDREYHYALVRDFDPALYEDVVRDLDVRQQLVFSPEWLRYSQVGWILYEADLTIKSVVTGLLQDGTRLSQAPVWDIPGFEPEWLLTDLTDRYGAGRANFELDDESSLPVNGSSINLSQIRPKLVIVHRKPGTGEDDPRPCDLCDRISGHFADHWQEYVKRVPALARMQTVFRAYVAARYLVKRHPGLAARIYAMPRPEVIDSTPLYHLTNTVLRVAIEDGKLAPLIPGSRVYHLGGGFGGGIAFKADDKIRPNQTSGKVDAWAATMFPTDYAGDGYRVEGNRVGVYLHFGFDRYPTDRQKRFWFFMVGASALFGLGVFAWQGLSSRETPAPFVCRHCIAVHRLTEPLGWGCDVTAVGTVIFLLCLPFAAAWHEARPSIIQAVIAFGAVAGSMSRARKVRGRMCYQ